MGDHHVSRADFGHRDARSNLRPGLTHSREHLHRHPVQRQQSTFQLRRELQPHHREQQQQLDDHCLWLSGRHQRRCFVVYCLWPYVQQQLQNDHLPCACRDHRRAGSNLHGGSCRLRQSMDGHHLQQLQHQQRCGQLFSGPCDLGKPMDRHHLPSAHRERPHRRGVVHARVR